MNKAKFCKFCGKELDESRKCDCREATERINENKVNNLTKRIISYMTKKNTMIVAAFFMVIIIGILAISGKEKIYLKDYIMETPYVEGLNGNGRISSNNIFDDYALESDLTSEIDSMSPDDFDKMSERQLENYFEKSSKHYAECEAALDDITVTLWKNGEKVDALTGLSNGDQIKIEAKSANPNNKYLKKKFKTGTVRYTIENLEDGKPVDIFLNAGLTVSFDGISGYGSAYLDYKAEAVPNLVAHFDFAELKNNLSNGDTIEVKLLYDNEDWESKGYYPIEESKYYKVEGLHTNLSNIEQIPTEQLNDMKSKVEASLEEETSEWLKEVSIENIDYLGYCLLTKKETNQGMGAPNILYLVYKVDVYENFSPNGGDDNHFSYYYYGGYEGITIDTEGRICFDNAYALDCLNSFSREVRAGRSILWSSTWLSYVGYDSLEVLFERCVNGYLDKYNYVTDIVHLEI